MFRRQAALFIALILSVPALIAFANPARALPAYLQAAQTAYSVKPGGVIASKGCNLCHAGATNKNSLNFYGKEVQGALQAAPDHQVTPALLHTLDQHDADGDGWPEISEFQADTLPGDPASKPAGPAPGSMKPSASARPAEESNPFGIKALFFPSHAQHPVVVHFPIALFIFSLFLDLFAVRSGNRTMHAAAYYNLAAAAVTGVISVITGLIAWKFARGGESLLQDRWLLYHLILGVVTAIMMCILWAVRSRQPAETGEPLSRIYIILGVITLVVIALTGHIGGIVSGVVS